MSNGSGDGGSDNGVKVEGGIVTTSQAVLEYLLRFDGFQDDVKVEGEGGVIATEVDEVEDIVFFLEETFDESEGILEGGRVEKGGRHCKRGFGFKESCWLSCECFRQLSEESLQVLSSFIALKNLGGIL